MNTNSLTEYLKTAFDYKNNGDYKKAIDYFYKALALDEESSEIMTELAFLYTKLFQYDRAVSYYEQILLRNPDDDNTKFLFSKLLKLTKEFDRAETFLLDLYNRKYEFELISEELFEVLLLTDKNELLIDLYTKDSDLLNRSIIFYNVALAYSKLCEYEKAEEYYKKSFEADEHNFDAGIKLALLLLEKGQVDNAEQLSLKLLKTAEDDRLYALLAEIYYSQANIDESIKYYSYAIKFNPQKADYYFKLAIAFSIKGFFKEAEGNYCRAIALEPENETYNYALAYMYYLNSKYDLAEKLVSSILKINADNYQALALKALLLINKNEVANAGKLLEELSECKVNDDFIFYVESVYYSKLNIWEKAATAINKAIELNETSIDYKYELAKLKYYLSDLETAQEICDNIIEMNSKYVQAYLLLAEVSIQQQEYDKAIYYANLSLDLDKNLAEAYAIIASISLITGEYEKAISNYKVALSINPSKEEYYTRIAECYYILENYNDSYSYFKEASNFDITNAQYRYYMAKCSIYNNDTENAIANFSVMKRLSPANIEYIEEYADYLLMIGEKKKAVAIMESTLKLLNNKDKKEDLKKNIKNLKKRC